MVKRKLIEVALPLEAINRESAREKATRQGHPSTLHLWWARRPLAACRAVLFAQLVDDPSSRPDLYPTDAEQTAKRKDLFALIERLVVWENIHDEGLLAEARQEILLSTGGQPPAILDPFAGGGSIPLEAQRLGLEARASDLNPVAVLINKALIEIPPKWADQPPVSPGSAESRLGAWIGTTGLAADIRLYGLWMRDQLERAIGQIYSPALLPDGSCPSVIAWIWARTVACPNPACGIRMPLVRSFWLAKKKGREAYLIPHVGNRRIEFSVGTDPGAAPGRDEEGTVRRTGAICLACRSAVPLSYIREEGKGGRLGNQLMAVVAEGVRRRIYLAPTPEQEAAADVPPPEDVPETEIPHNPRYLTTPNYGMRRHVDLFTARQLTVVTILSDLVDAARQKAMADGLASGLAAGDALESGGVGAQAYADSIAIMMAFAVDRIAMTGNSLCRWNPVGEKAQHMFGRQAIPMLWDFAETAVMGSATGSWSSAVEMCAQALDGVPTVGRPSVEQADAAARDYSHALVATDPPYYDNVGYADLSDVFYIWLRRSLGEVLPRLVGTMLTPKEQELVADPFRRGGMVEAESFFETGFVEVFRRIRQSSPADYPISVFYAFKQSESGEAGTASTGWQTLLEGMLRSGWEVTATWPIRTEMATRMRGLDSNALASSIVLALRPRAATAEALTRRGFLGALREQLPVALHRLQQGGIAPVDLAQAAIGPGMSVYSRYARVIEADGTEMSVRTALALINEVLDAVLSAQEGDFDSDTRFCLKWFTTYGWDEADSGTADTLARATNSSMGGLERGGIFLARAGRARLLGPGDLADNWDPTADERISVWEVVLRVAAALEKHGSGVASRLLGLAGRRVDLDTAKELAYLMYSICEKRGWAASALLFNGLGTSWSDLSTAARSAATQTPEPVQDALDFESEEA